jgi:hypothetical protein
VEPLCDELLVPSWFLLGAMDKMSIFVILQEGVYMNTMAIYTKPQYHGLIFRVKIISFY